MNDAETAPLDGADPDTGAAAVVADIAVRLADPATVAARAGAPHNRRRLPDGRSASSWDPRSLALGNPGIALLYAELQHTDAAYRQLADGHLAAVVGELADAAAPPPGLYNGPLAFAFAASCAAQGPHDGPPELAAIDRRAAARVPARLRPEQARIEATIAGTTFDAYDVIAGATGVGAYLLRRGERLQPALCAVLGYLTALALSTPEADPPVPGWWVAHPRSLGGPTHGGRGEHANLGLAHGICGPLALLSLAWQAGQRVPRQDEAIVRIVDWLLAWRSDDEAGRFWPDTLSLTDLAADPTTLPRARSAWCYGAPGMARAIQLAGIALGRDDWTAVAVASTRGLLAHLDADHGLTDPALCHGWAGILHLTRLIGIDSGDPAVIGAAPRLVARILDRYDPAAPFGFRADRPGIGSVDVAGFLEGAAGIALALHSYVSGIRPVTGWDGALLVA